MSKLIFLLICYNLLHLNLAEYEAPRSVEYPFGDEEFNTDIKEGRFPEEFKPILLENITDIEVFCPNKTEEEDPDPFGGAVPHSDKKCQKCDIRPTVDKAGALLECYNCTDVSALTLPEKNITKDHILYLANYLEITNYTAPEST